MIYRIVFRPEAEADLDALYDFISDQSGVGRAGKFVTAIDTFCMGLAHFPERGRLREDLAPELRTLAFDRRVLVAYRIEGQIVRILHVFYAGRNYEGDLRDV